MVSLQDDAEAREFLSVVDEHGGRAPTKMIREETSLSESQIQYRYRKLEQKDLIRIERDESLTPNNEAMKIAVLTDTAKEEIDKGLLVSTKEERDTSPDADELADEVRELQGQMAEMQEMMELMDEMEEMEQLMEQVEQVERRVDELDAKLTSDVGPGLRLYYEAVGRLEASLEQSDVEVVDEVPAEKKQELNQRLQEKQEARSGD